MEIYFYNYVKRPEYENIRRLQRFSKKSKKISSLAYASRPSYSRHLTRETDYHFDCTT